MALVILALSIVAVPINLVAIFGGLMSGDDCVTIGNCNRSAAQDLALAMPFISQAVGTGGSILLLTVLAKTDAKTWRWLAVIVSVVSLVCLVSAWLLHLV